MSVEDFVSGVDRLVRSGRDPSVVAETTAPLLEEFIGDPSALPERYRKPLRDTYTQYPLYRAGDGAWSILCAVFLPGQGTPIHDHGTWGVVGILQGEEEERRFRRVDGGSGDEGVQLVEEGVGFNRRGEVSVVKPPEIHRVRTISDITSISIHVYGADIGTQHRYIYHPEKRERKVFISGWDAVPQ